MRDPALERHHGAWWAYHRRRRDLGARTGRCPVCGCIPRVEWAHEVAADPELAPLPYHVLTTCGSAYCRSRDWGRFLAPAVLELMRCACGRRRCSGEDLRRWVAQFGPHPAPEPPWAREVCWTKYGASCGMRRWSPPS